MQYSQDPIFCGSTLNVAEFFSCYDVLCYYMFVCVFLGIGKAGERYGGLSSGCS